ncbi:MAG: GspH/FimT family pseudopilin [Ramlibacter sp.]
MGRSGLTLVELLTVLSIAAVLLASAAPPMFRLLHSVNLSTASNAFLSSLRLARSEALRRGGRVAMCRSSNGLSCATAGSWEQGWIVFHDLNANGLADPGETLIQRADAVGGGLVLHGTAQVAAALTFTGMGSMRTAAGGLQAGTFTVCRPLDVPAVARQIVLASGGRARVVQVTLDTCA